MSGYRVEVGIPVPRKKAISLKYPFNDMRTGDSFFVPVNEVCKDSDNPDKCSRTLSGAAWSYGERHNMKFIHRQCVEKDIRGFRVWRTA